MKNIVFKKIAITNFLSFGKTQEYVFNDGITLISGINKDRGDDPNGAGKTTVNLAISFALFGKTYKDISVSSLVNRIAKKNGVVQLDMEIDGYPFSIIRGCKPSFVKIIEDGKEKQFAGIKPTDEYIAAKIGTDYLTFKNTVMMSSLGEPFLQQNAENKRKFIESLFNIEFIRGMASILKDENAQKLQEFRENGLQLDSARSSLERFQKMRDDEIRNIEQGIKDREEQYNQSVADLGEAEKEFSLAKVPESADKLNDELSGIDKEISDINKECERLRKEDCAFYAQKYTSAEHQYSESKKFVDETTAWIEKVEAGLKERGFREDFWTIYGKREVYEDSISEIGRKISDAKAVPIANNTVIRNLESQKHELLSGDKCPTCGHVFTEEEKSDTALKAKHFDDKVAELLRRNEEAKSEIESLEAERTDAERYLKVANAGVTKQVDRVSDVKSKLDSMKAECDELRQKFDDAHEAEHKLSANIAELSVRRGEISNRIYQIENEISNYNAKKQRVERCKSRVEDCLSALDAAKKKTPTSTSFIKEYEDKIANFEKVANEIEYTLEVYSLAKRVLADDGYRAELVGRIVAALNAKANEYLAKLDAPVTISIDKYFSDNIVDIGTGEVVEYNSLSGGEQRRIDLAMLLAFMDIRSMQGDAKFGTLFFDEILDSALSGNACCRFLEILKSKHTEENIDSVVISHRKELSENDNIDNRVMVVKLGGVSSISSW